MVLNAGRTLVGSRWNVVRTGWRGTVLVLIVAGCLSTLVLVVATSASLQPVPSLRTLRSQIYKPRLLDRNGQPLTVTFQNRWNLHDQVALYDVPLWLQQSFVMSEDQRFFSHKGVDWLARLHAAWQNLVAADSVRGASTITEQVVRLLHPRERTLWARWLEGFEAQRLEAKNSKADILEFYLNQVPYAAQRRGIVQAANYYFNRDLSTLTTKELLALVVMIRAPGRFNLHQDVTAVEQRTELLLDRMLDNGLVSRQRAQQYALQTLRASHGDSRVQARHFARYVYTQVPENTPTVETTLDSTIQYAAQRILDQRLGYLEDKNIDNAALLVVDHHSSEILAWVVGNSSSSEEKSSRYEASEYDAVRRPRQPGSALKPFVYALALSKGWTAATLIDDSPLSEAIGHGLHTYHNYSRIHYGPVSLREALGNSLNIPAVKTMQFVGAELLLNTLHDLGIKSLDRHPDYYGDGLALGNGELTLYELVQAYATLARGGIFTPLHAIRSQPEWPVRRTVFSEQVATLIGNILSDADARRLEFGNSGLLDFPVQTALKTGTSSDYRDAWAVGYNYRYTAGVWMGNLHGGPMHHVTGSTGPALVLRSVLAELMRTQPSKPLSLSPLLVKRNVCVKTGLSAGEDCEQHEEWFVSTGQPQWEDTNTMPLRIRQPYTGLQIALDPRIPDTSEAFEFQLSNKLNITEIQWVLDNKTVAESDQSSYAWPLVKGNHTLAAKVRYSDSRDWVETPPVKFVVK
jgi:penicillin-binding protein 1C